MYRVMLLASRLGVLNLLGRVMGERVAPPTAMKLPAELRPTYLEVGFQPKYFQANLDESSAGAESDRQLRATGSLGDIPLTVIRHGIPDLFARMPAEQSKESELVWQELQADLSRLSADSRMLVAERSGHGIQIDQPGVVVDAVRDMVERCRRSLESRADAIALDPDSH